MQSVPITTKVTSWNPAHGEVYLIQHYTITNFCLSEYEFLLTCKIMLTEAEGRGQYWFCRSIKTDIH